MYSIFIPSKHNSWMREDQKIHFTYLTGRLSATLIIPIELARRHGLTKASNVIVEETTNGLLLRSKNLKSSQ